MFEHFKAAGSSDAFSHFHDEFVLAGHQDLKQDSESLSNSAMNFVIFETNRVSEIRSSTHPHPVWTDFFAQDSYVVVLISYVRYLKDSPFIEHEEMFGDFLQFIDSYQMYHASDVHCLMGNTDSAVPKHLQNRRVAVRTGVRGRLSLKKSQCVDTPSQSEQEYVDTLSQDEEQYKEEWPDELMAQRSEDELWQLVSLQQPRGHLPDAAKDDHSEDDE
jgi:hypothetical protein